MTADVVCTIKVVKFLLLSFILLSSFLLFVAHKSFFLLKLGIFMFVK